MDVFDLIEFGDKYQTTQQEQFKDFMNREFETLNHNAVKEFGRLARFHVDIQERLEEYERWRHGPVGV